MSDAVATPPRDTSMEVAVRVRNAKLKKVVTDLTGDRDRFKADADRLAKENADLKAKGDSSVLSKRVQELEGKLKEIEYRKTFDRVAKARGIREDALDAAYQLGGYKPSADEIDEDALELAIDEQRGRQTFLAGKVDSAATEKPPLKPAPGSGQGGKTGGTGALQLADDDPRLKDNVWVWEHQDEIMEAIKAKRERGVV